MADQKTTWEYGANDRLSAVLDKIEAKFSKLDGTVNRSEGKMNRFFSGFAGGAFGINNAMQLMDRIGSAIQSTAGRALKLSMDFEQTQISFQTMTGSVSAGNALLGQLKNLADTTILANDATYKAGTTLLQFGVDQKKILPLMTQFGDIAGANKEKLQSLALVFGQITSAGKLQGQDLRQLTELGFNPLQMIAKKLNTSMADVMDRMHDGAISVEMVEQAFVDATSEGGIFFNMMEKQSLTLAGRLSTLDSRFTNLLTDIGKKMEPFAHALIDIGNMLIDNWNTIADVLIFTGSAIAAAGTAWLLYQGYVVGATLVTMGFTGVMTALNLVMMANPVGFIVTAIGLLIGGLVLAYKHSEKFRAVLAGIWSVIKVVSDLFIGFVQILAGFEEGWARFGNAGANLATKGVKGIFNEGFDDSMNSNLHGAGGSWATPENDPNNKSPALKSLGSDVKSVSSGGKSVRNVNVTFKNLVENLNVHATTVKEGMGSIRKEIEEALVRVVHDSEIAISPDGN